MTRKKRDYSRERDGKEKVEFWVDSQTKRLIERATNASGMNKVAVFARTAAIEKAHETLAKSSLADPPARR